MKTIISIVIAALLGAAGAYMLLDKKSQSKVFELETEMKSLGDESKSLRDQLFGYTKYTDYVTPGKKVMTEQAKFLAAKVVRNYQLVENLQAGWLGLQSNASVVIPYSVEFSFGYDLKTSDFELNATPNGLEIKLGKPILVAAPAVTPGKPVIATTGLWTQEKDAIISILQKLPAQAQVTGSNMATEEPIGALCEKKLAGFLRDFIGKQPGVKHVPNITVVYK